MKLLLYGDVETTGKDTSTAGITQMSFLIIRNGKEVDRLNLNINPFTYKRPITVSKKALEITNKTEEDLRAGMDVPIAFIRLVSWLNKHRKSGEYYTFIAYRTLFDLEMLQGLFKDQLGDSRKIYNYIHFKHLDILQLVLFMELYDLLNVKNHKLETMCNSFNIKIKAHDSMSDIEATRKLHKSLMSSLGLNFTQITNV